MKRRCFCFILTISVLLAVVGCRPSDAPRVAESPRNDQGSTLADSLRRAKSDDAQTIEEAFFHGSARALVISRVEPNKLRIGGGEFRVKRNPVGEGCFVYDPRTEFDGVQRNLIWWVPEDDVAYPLNGPSKMVTPGLRWSREAGIEAPSTKVVIDYLFAGKAMTRTKAPSPARQAGDTFTVKEYRIYSAVIGAPMSISETEAMQKAAQRFGVNVEEVRSATKKVQRILFTNKWMGTPESEIRHASDWGHSE